MWFGSTSQRRRDTILLKVTAYPLQQNGTYTLLLALLLGIEFHKGCGFRVVDENGTMKPFTPYEQGFVGRYGDPLTTYVGNRINEGAPGTPTYPRLYEGVHPRQTCPGMVGPAHDGLYYCLGKDYGYCDRRSGTCFCNTGYQGISCQDCSPTHYAQGGLCYPKLLCPNDCSGAGTCNYSNGTCSCFSHRVGDDCSSPYCSAVFNPLCTECTFERCTGCESGYYVDEDGGGSECLPCVQYDPRCTRCNPLGCQECMDPLLLSIRRSGARDIDPPLPFDELERELPHALPFGTKDPRFFASAEAFDVVANLSNPLNESSLACAQGLQGDDTWTCEPKAVSHKVCGNPGTITFSSPEYEAFEGSPVDWDDFSSHNGSARISVLRTGGGVGTVGVKYRLRHGDTDASDVTAHAFYTSSTSLVFAPGVVELSFLISVHQDGEPEPNEYFDLFLDEPWGGARLGAQQRTRITVIDHDSNGSTTDHMLSEWMDASVAVGFGDDRVQAIAGVTSNFTVVSRDALGRERGQGGDVFAVWVEASVGTESEESGVGYGMESLVDSGKVPLGTSPGSTVMSQVQDLESGNYTVSYRVDVAGQYKLHVALCRPGGLSGAYFTDAFFSDQAFQRIDRVMNLTWGSGAVAASATDFVGIIWNGHILPDHTEEFKFELGTAEGGDAARLWVDGRIVIDGFQHGGTGAVWNEDTEGLGGGGTGFVNLTAVMLHEVTIEYSERRGDASLYLAWSSISVPYEIIPSRNLYWSREIGAGPRPLRVRSASTDGAQSESFGEGTLNAVAALPSTLTIVPRDKFGNLRMDDKYPDVVQSDRFSALLEAMDYDSDDITSGEESSSEGGRLGGVFGAAGSGGRVVTATVEYLEREGVFVAEYVPFVAGIHRLNVTFQEWAFEPYTHVRGSPFTVTVLPGEAFGRRSEAWGDALSGNGTAGVSMSLVVRSRDVVGNSIEEGGGKLSIIAFHSEVEVYAAGSAQDLGNGSYLGEVTPRVAGSYDVFVSLNDQEVANSPYSVMVTPEDAYGPASVAYGNGLSAAVATLENAFYVQANDQWGNHLWNPYFNVTGELFVGSNNVTTEDGIIIDARDTNTSGNTSVIAADMEDISVGFLGNGSGIARVTYVPLHAGTRYLHVCVDDLPVSGSPFALEVLAGPPRGANATASGSALALATAGENSSFIIQARDRQANPAATTAAEDRTVSETSASFAWTGNEYEDLFNVTLTRTRGDAQDMGDDDAWDNSTIFHAVVEPLGFGRYRAIYNVTVAGNYSLEIMDALDGEHAVGSPYDVLVEPAQAFAPATIVWWDKQIAGENVVHLQAADFWKNNLTRGGDIFVARFTERFADRALQGVVLEEEESLAEESTDTGATASGFDPRTSNLSPSDGFSFESSNATVVDKGSGRYEVTTATVAGRRWLEIGVVEPGGLWGTYYQDGGVFTAGKAYWAPEASWHTKGVVNFNWGLLSPEVACEDQSDSSLSSNASSSYENASTNSRDAPSSPSFPTDYFSARFGGFVMVETEAERILRVTTDSNSKVALYVAGHEVFNDLRASSDLDGIDDWESNASAVATIREGTVRLAARKLIPLELRYAHAMGEAAVRLEWSRRTDRNPSVIPVQNLYHLRLGCKIALDLHPAATAAWASTAVWAARSPNLWPSVVHRNGDEAREVTAGHMLEILVEARDSFGNSRGVGGDAVQVYARGLGGVMLHGSTIDNGDGTYGISVWPIVAGAYQMSVLVRELEPSQWALGYRSVEQVLAHAHVVGSPFRLSVMPGELSANTTVAFGAGIVSSLAGGLFGTSDFRIRGHDSMGNRINNGRTGDFVVRVFEEPVLMDEGDESVESPLASTWPVYVSGGEYQAEYNITESGRYALHVTSTMGAHIAGSPFVIHVLPGPDSAGTFICDNCLEKLSERNFSVYSEKILRLSSRDMFGNTIKTGGAEWYTEVSRELEGVSSWKRHPKVTDRGDGTYGLPIGPGVAGLYSLQVSLLGRARQGEQWGSKSYGLRGGGLTAHYFANERFTGKPHFTRVDSAIRLDWASHVPQDLSAVASAWEVVGIRWDGFLQTRLSEEFTISASTGVADEARLWLHDELVIDTSSQSAESSPNGFVQPTRKAVGTFSMEAGVAIPLRVEYLHRSTHISGGRRAPSVRIALEWESARTPLQAVPPAAFYPGAEAIPGSPFLFSVG